ncbi:MAG: ABC transporter ATP-binding protein [Oscillospiraceae bacterium]|nr:ABC transporter ATP-binding protein [Oscillospiraceae bacterium]
MENIIEIKGLVKNYDGFSLKEVGFCLPKGSVMGFIGQNGAGKSTTIKAILNLIKTDGGSVTVFGKDSVKDEEAIKEQIGVVFDEPCFHDVLNANQINKVFKGIYKEWSEEAFFGYMKRFELPLKRKFKDFSRGMKMKMQIAVALSHNAKLLIMDEPTSGLDPVVRNEVLDVFMEYLLDGERSILISSHITVDLEKIADYVTFIDKGRIFMSDNKDNVLDNHRIIKCGKSDIDKIDSGDIAGKRENEFGVEVLIKSNIDRYSDMTLDRATLDEIILFYVKGNHPSPAGHPSKEGNL